MNCLHDTQETSIKASDLFVEVLDNDGVEIPRRCAFELPLGGGMPQGGLNLDCPGMAEADGYSNINVSRCGTRRARAGGFINISRNARRPVFAGTFTTGGLELAIGGARVYIAGEGPQRKFVEAVEQSPFNGALSARKDQPVLCVTERCMFELVPESLRLIEVAPGIDVERDIAGRTAFRPLFPGPRRVDPRIDRPRPTQLLASLLDLRLADRLSCDAERNLGFANFEGLVIRSPEDVESVRRVFDAMCSGLGHRVALVVNCDGFRLVASLSDACFERVSERQARHYSAALRFTTGALMRRRRTGCPTRGSPCLRDPCRGHRLRGTSTAGSRS